MDGIDTMAGSKAPGWKEAAVVRLHGRLDSSTGNAALHRLLAAIGPGGSLVVDVSAVEAVDPAGAEILAAARRQARVLGGDLRLIGASCHPLLCDAAPAAGRGACAHL